MENGEYAQSGPSEAPTNSGHWYQFSVGALFGLTGIAAGFFSVGSILGYVDATIILLALMVLFRAMRRPQRVHAMTAVILTLVTGVFLWANLRPTRWQEGFGLATPTDLDRVTQAVFWRGWPLSPFMVCLVHGMKLHASGVQWVLVFDGVFFVLALVTVKAVCERCLRWCDRRRSGIVTVHGNLRGLGAERALGGA